MEGAVHFTDVHCGTVLGAALFVLLIPFLHLFSHFPSRDSLAGSHLTRHLVTCASCFENTAEMT